jgi:hypothetical protein
MSCTCNVDETCKKDKNLSSCFATINAENAKHCPFPDEIIKVYTMKKDNDGQKQWKTENKTAEQLSAFHCPEDIPFRGTSNNYPDFCFATKKCSDKFAFGCNGEKGVKGYAFAYRPKAYMLVHKPCMNFKCAKVPHGFALSCNEGYVKNVESKLKLCPNGEIPVTCEVSPQEMSIGKIFCEDNDDCKIYGKTCNLGMCK